MTVNSATSTTSTAYQPAGQATTETTGTKTLGQNDFLKLLAVQMQAQDPMSPMQDTEFISQMANFTSLEQMKNLTTAFQSFTSQQTATAVQTYLGKTVSVTDSNSATGTVTGQVTNIKFDTGKPMIVVNGNTYDPAAISNIQASNTSGTSTATTTN